MKNLKKASFLLVLAVCLSGCSDKGKEKSVVNNYITNPSTGTGTDTGTDTSTDSQSDPGGYYTNLPTLVFSGSGVAGYNYWSSATDLPADISPNQFRTDARFAVRIKQVVVDGGTSRQGRICSQYKKDNAKRMQVKLMLSRTSDNGLSTNIKTLTTTVGNFSNTARFTVPAGTSDPYVLSVVSVLTDSRCNAYGTAPSGCPNSYFDIPVQALVSSTTPTECVGFEIQFATDDTKDLPN